MTQLRFEALKKLDERPKVLVDPITPNISQFFGEYVFGMEQMRATLAPAVFKKVSAAIKNHEKIDKLIKRSLIIQFFEQLLSLKRIIIIN